MRSKKEARQCISIGLIFAILLLAGCARSAKRIEKDVRSYLTQGEPQKALRAYSELCSKIGREEPSLLKEICLSLIREAQSDSQKTSPSSADSTSSEVGSSGTREVSAKPDPAQIRQLLRSKSKNDRVKGITLSIGTQDRQVLELLRLSAQDSSDDIKRWSAWALGEKRDTLSIPLIGRELLSGVPLNEELPEKAAIQMFVMLDRSRSARPGSDVLLREEAATALGAMRSASAIPFLKQALLGVRVSSRAGKIGPLLRETDPLVRSKCVLALCRIGSDDAAPVLKELLTELPEEPFIGVDMQIEVSLALCHIGDLSGLHELKRLLSSDLPKTRVKAARALLVLLEKQG